MALKDTCIHPETKKPYVLSVKGGYDGNPVKHQVRSCLGAGHIRFFSYSRSRALSNPADAALPL